MIDIDALIKNPERRKKYFHVISQKTKKTAKYLAKLLPIIRKVVQSRAISYQKSCTLAQMKDI